MHLKLTCAPNWLRVRRAVCSGTGRATLRSCWHASRADRNIGFGYCTHMVAQVRWSDRCKIDRLSSYKPGKSYQPTRQRRCKCCIFDWRVIFKPKAIDDQCIGRTLQLWIKACPEFGANLIQQPVMGCGKGRPARLAF